MRYRLVRLVCGLLPSLLSIGTAQGRPPSEADCSVVLAAISRHYGESSALSIGVRFGPQRLPSLLPGEAGEVARRRFRTSCDSALSATEGS